MSHLKYLVDSFTRIYLIVEVNLTCPLGYFRTKDVIPLNLSACCIFYLEISLLNFRHLAHINCNLHVDFS